MFFFSFLNIVVDFHRPVDDYDLSFKIPYFAYFYSQYSTGGITDSWKKFKLKYEEDESVALAEIECENNQALCHIQLDHLQLPVVLPIRRGIPQKSFIPQNSEDLEKLLLQESDYNRSRLCRQLPNEFFTYPTIIYNTTKDLDIACSEALEAAYDSPKAYQYFYVQKSTKESLYYDTGYNFFQIYIGNVPKTELHDAIYEYTMVPLRPVDLEKAKNLKRRVALFVSDSIFDLLQFEHDASLVTEGSYVGRISISDFNETFGETYQIMNDELPALLLFSKGMTKWMIMPNIGKEQMNMTKLFIDHQNGDYDTQMLFEMEAVKVIDYSKYYYLSIVIMSVLIVISFMLTTLKCIFCQKQAQTKVE